MKDDFEVEMENESIGDSTHQETDRFMSRRSITVPTGAGGYRDLTMSDRRTEMWLRGKELKDELF